MPTATNVKEQTAETCRRFLRLYGAIAGQGYPCASSADDDTQTRLAMLDGITPGTVSVWACGGSADCAH